MEEKINRRCVDCGIDPPVSEGAITLMSIKHGWRLARIRTPDGESVMQWRCKDCWDRQRRERGNSNPP